MGVCVGANRARQLLRLGTEVVKSQLAEIGLVSTLLDSGAQDRDDIANDSVLARPGQLGRAGSPGGARVACGQDKGMTYRLNAPPADQAGEAAWLIEARPTITEVAVIGSGNGASPKPKILFHLTQQATDT